MSADLTVSVRAPDGAPARIRVTGDGGELVADVDRPLVVARALPARNDLRSLSRLVRLTTPSADPGAPAMPPLRVRAGGRTLAVVRRGRVRPSPVVAGAAVVSLAALAVGAAGIVRALRGAGRSG